MIKKLSITKSKPIEIKACDKCGEKTTDYVEYYKDEYLPCKNPLIKTLCSNCTSSYMECEFCGKIFDSTSLFWIRKGEIEFDACEKCLTKLHTKIGLWLSDNRVIDNEKEDWYEGEE